MSALPQFREFIFLWPQLLWLLLLAPLLIWWYRRVDALQRLSALRFAQLASATTSGGGHTDANVASSGAWKRHAPALLLWLGIVMLMLALARPQAQVVLPTRADAIMLALDVSGSMRANDVKPDRISAAQQAAKTFVSEQPARVKVGLVTMAATASVTQSPTSQREDLIAALDRVKLQNGSALGSGIVIALKTLLPDPGFDVDKVISGTSSYNLSDEQRAAIASFRPVPPGSNASAVIVLLSDGESNTGPDLLTAAKLAAERGVRVYTVGLGTRQGATLSVDGWSMRVRLDEDTLKKVADMTRGEYFQASSSAELKKIYRQLAARMTLGRARTMELTALLAAVGLMLALAAVSYSMLRFNRLL
jgi:Ca-activated chloride channel family protein